MTELNQAMENYKNNPNNCTADDLLVAKNKQEKGQQEENVVLKASRFIGEEYEDA